MLAKHANLASSPPNHIAAADPDTPYPNDYVHFGTPGILEMGRRMVEKMHEKLSNAK